MKIGIEHEVGVLSQTKALSEILGTVDYQSQLNQYTPLENIPNHQSVEVAFDKEYYSTQYEVKAKGFEPTIHNLDALADYFASLYTETSSIQNKGPDFVGTHIHLFKNYSPTNAGTLQVTARVFKEMKEFWHSQYQNQDIAPLIRKAELKRLTTSNNLLKFFDYAIMGSVLSEMAHKNGINFQYRDIGYNRPKYCPVIWSPALGGKEFSLELRFISNTYFLMAPTRQIKELVTDVENIINIWSTTNRTDTEHDMLNVEAMTSIVKDYIYLTTLHYGETNNMSLRNVEKRIRELLSIGPVRVYEGRLRFIREFNLNMIPKSDILWKSERSAKGKEYLETKPTRPSGNNDDDYDDYDDDECTTNNS